MSNLLNYSPGTIGLLNELIHLHTGICFEADQQDRLLDKLLPLVVEKGMDSLMDYYYLLKYGDEAQAEWKRVAQALAVNETYFWREFDQIRAAAEILVPHIHRERPRQPARIWHASCASGEEPYTMAIALTEADVFQSGEVEIIATDFNEVALNQAREGIYRNRSFRSIPQDILDKYFTKAGAGQWRLSNSILSRVTLLPLNLMDPDRMATMRGFDMIFCRNTFIYFSTCAIQQVAERFHWSLRSPGHLFIAAAESLLKITTLFELAEVGGAFVYKKN